VYLLSNRTEGANDLSWIGVQKMKTMKLRTVLKLRPAISKWSPPSFPFAPSSLTPSPGLSTFPFSTNVDIAILGGGMVGGSLACSLAVHPAFRDKKIVLLEQGRPSAGLISTDSPWSNRVCEISPASASYLEGIGVWPLIQQQRLKSVEMMQVWDAASDSYIVFHPSTSSSSSTAVSWTVENDVTTSAVDARLQQLSQDNENIEVLHEAHVAKVSIPGGKGEEEEDGYFPEVTLADGRVLTAKLIVGADGTNSAVRKAAKIKTIDYDFKQKGVVATLRLEKAFGNTVAWQRFLPSGPIAVLPLDEFHSSLVWSVSEGEASRLLEMSEDAFATLVHMAVWGNSPETQPSAMLKKATSMYSRILPPPSGRQMPPAVVGCLPGSRASFPLKTANAIDYAKDRVVLVGDAAHRIHPMAGQGVNLGFGDAAKLTQALADGVGRGADLGCETVLKDFETARLRKSVPLIVGLQALHWLYGSTFPPIVGARSLGLQTVDAIPSLKALFSGYAMQH